MANAGASVMLAAKAARDKAIALALTGRDALFAGAAAENVLARISHTGRDLRSDRGGYTSTL